MAEVILPPDLPQESISALKGINVPVVSLKDECAGCDWRETCDDHDVGENGYPKGVEVDLESVMFPSMKGFHRLALVSTSVSDWPRDVTDDSSSLAGLLSSSYSHHAHKSPMKTIKRASGFLDIARAKITGHVEGKGGRVVGVFDKNWDGGHLVENKLTILNASFHETEDDELERHKYGSVMVFPDFRLVTPIKMDKESVDEAVERYIGMDVDRLGTASPSSRLKSYILPYRVVVLLCSHKRRDKRCHLTAPSLIRAFSQAFENEGWEVDERGDEWVHHSGETAEGEGEGEEALMKRLKEAAEGNMTGIFKVSHIGGHKYAGNVILAFPNGTQLWYGRVTPFFVPLIVQKTIKEGMVIQELLRGGIGMKGNWKQSW
ncbi:hypothetical protein BT69DRAFT_1334957 [Atractiella rhizophila]|nr:hypothetical protein BT69DRAFT_1334957 [Atractiella rhizophila]